MTVATRQEALSIQRRRLSDPRQNWIEAKSRLKRHEAAQAPGHEANVGFCGRFDYASRRGSVDESCANRIVVGLPATNGR